MEIFQAFHSSTSSIESTRSTPLRAKLDVLSFILSDNAYQKTCIFRVFLNDNFLRKKQRPCRQQHESWSSISFPQCTWLDPNWVYFVLKRHLMLSRRQSQEIIIQDGRWRKFQRKFHVQWGLVWIMIQRQRSFDGSVFNYELGCFQVCLRWTPDSLCHVTHKVFRGKHTSAFLKKTSLSEFPHEFFSPQILGSVAGC